MKIKLLITLILIAISNLAISQKKVNIDLNFNVYNSIGNETLKNYQTSDGYLGLEYFDKKRFKNPFISLTTNIFYPILKIKT